MKYWSPCSKTSVRIFLLEACLSKYPSKVANFDKFLFPVDDDLLTQDYQTPAEVGLAKDEFLGVYPVMKLQLDKSSDGPSIDSMVDASKEYFNKVTAPLPQRSLNSRIENIRNLVRGIKEDTHCLTALKEL